MPQQTLVIIRACLVILCLVGFHDPVIGAELDCSLSAAELATGFVVVDTRPAEDFRRLRIPGSINLPAYALKTKDYLKAKRLLLVGRNGVDAALEPLCRSLRGAGFEHVAVLQGGLRWWAKTVGALAGDASIERGLLRLSPAEVAAAEDRWQMIDVSPDATAALPNALRVPFRPGHGFAEALNEAIDGGGPEPFVLLADRDGSAYGALERVLSLADLPQIYLLDGGAKAYRAFAEQRRRITESAARGCTLGRCGAP